MKKLLLLTAIAIMSLSCSKDCDEQLEQLNRDYHNALQNAHSIEAVEEIKRQYQDAKNNLDC